MSESTPFPYQRVALVALAASAVGLSSVLLLMGEMDDFLRSYVLVAIVSVLLWFVLAKRLRGESVWFAAIIGLLSPVIACLALAPLGIGFVWAVGLAEAWYFTLPIALFTGVVMHRAVNEAQWANVFSALEWPSPRQLLSLFAIPSERNLDGSEQENRMREITVQRRFPTYDFALRTSSPVPHTANVLEAFLQNQIRPTGFVLTDPRVDGQVFGSTFTLRRREASFGGSVAPYAEGQMIPDESGTIVLVRVRIPFFWWFFDVFMLVVFVVLIASSPAWETVVGVLFVGVFLLVLSVGPMWVEGSQLCRLLDRALPPSA